MISIEGKYSTAHVMTNEKSVPEDEYKQILSFVNCHVFTEDSRIMPDYHYGKGCVVGFTMPLTDKVIPNIVGVDIGCNMLYTNFRKDLKLDKSEWLDLDKRVREAIPMGMRHRAKPAMDMTNGYPWNIASLQKDVFTTNLNKKFGTNYKGPDYSADWFFELCERVKCKPVAAVNSLGSLGGGNHFIEFSKSDATGYHGVTIHAGSRNLGLKIANYWQNKAKENMKDRYVKDRNKQILELKANLPMEKWDAAIKATKSPPTPTGLEYLEGDDWYGYLHEMNFAQIYAAQNLNIMMQVILGLLSLPATLLMSEDTVHTVHNYISFEDFITRKGAVRSIAGKKMLIPFNMEDGILICEGKSNPEWNYSAPHGAGRLFGRKEMKRREDINTRDIRKRMNQKGILTSVLPKDEVKEAYKDPKFIEEAIAPTATIVDRLRPVLNIKADD